MKPLIFINIFKSQHFWKRVALIAGLFSIVVSILLIANYVQFKKADPINMSIINLLVERLNQNPDDAALREQIRTLDLLSRKAYFTNQWQIRTGGYLVLSGLLVMIISFQMISLYRKKEPIIPTESIENSAKENQNARKWLIISGSIFVVLALILAVFSHNDLKNRIKNSTFIVKRLSNAIDSTTTVSEISADTSRIALATITTIDTITATTSMEKEINKNENFPTFRGWNGIGIAKQKNIPTSWDGKSGKNIKWKTAISLTGFSSPIVWNNKVFVTGASKTKREVYCIDKLSGKIVWITEVAKVSDESGKIPEVSEETGYSAPTAATDGKSVFAIFANGDIIALDMDGKKLWALNLGNPQNHYGHSSSLMLYNDLVIVQYDQKKSPKLVAVSTKTGKIVWSVVRPVKVSWSSPIIVKTDKRSEIIVTAEPYAASYNPNTGEELWKMKCIDGEVGPSPAYSNGIVFTINEYSKLTAIKIGDEPEVLWENSDILSDVPSPVATEKYLIVASSGGTVVCYDTQTGEKYWEEEMNNSVYSSPIIVDDKVYLIDRTGVMHIFKVDKEYKSVGKAAIGEASSCTPAFSEGLIFIRGDKNLYCIGK